MAMYLVLKHCMQNTATCTQLLPASASPHPQRALLPEPRAGLLAAQHFPGWPPVAPSPPSPSLWPPDPTRGHACRVWASQFLPALQQGITFACRLLAATLTKYLCRLQGFLHAPQVLLGQAQLLAVLAHPEVQRFHVLVAAVLVLLFVQQSTTPSVLTCHM